MHIFMSIRMYVCIHVYVAICVFVFICVYVYAYTYVRKYLCIYLCLYTYVCMYTCLCSCMYICVFVLLGRMYVFHIRIFYTFNEWMFESFLATSFMIIYVLYVVAIGMNNHLKQLKVCFGVKWSLKVSVYRLTVWGNQSFCSKKLWPQHSLLSSNFVAWQL